MSNWHLLWIVPVTGLFLIGTVSSFVRMLTLDDEIAENQLLCPDGYNASHSKYEMKGGVPAPAYENDTLILWVDCTKVTQEDGHYNKDVITIRKQ